MIAVERLLQYWSLLGFPSCRLAYLPYFIKFNIGILAAELDDEAAHFTIRWRLSRPADRAEAGHRRGTISYGPACFNFAPDALRGELFRHQPFPEFADADYRLQQASACTHEHWLIISRNFVTLLACLFIVMGRRLPARALSSSLSMPRRSRPFVGSRVSALSPSASWAISLRVSAIRSTCAHLYA